MLVATPLAVMSQQAFCFCQRMKKPAMTSLIRLPLRVQHASHFQLIWSRTAAFLMDSSLSHSPWWSGFNGSIRLRESSESEPAVYSYSNLPGSGEHFSIVLKPLLTEQRTIGDGRHPDFSNDLCVSLFRFLSGRFQHRWSEVRIFICSFYLWKTKQSEFQSLIRASGFLWLSITFSVLLPVSSLLRLLLLPYLPLCDRG